MTAFIIWKNHSKHKERSKDKEMDQIFNLKKVTDVNDAISTNFEHLSLFVSEIRTSLDKTLAALFDQNEYQLKAEHKKVKRIQKWTNIIIANIFKSMRLLQQEDSNLSYTYGQTIRRLQKLADGHRDIVIRSHLHISNHHKGLLGKQIEELQKVRQILHDILLNTELALINKDINKYKVVIEKDAELKKLAENLNKDQIERIKCEESKTRLSILFYTIVGNSMMLSKQNLKLMEIFSKTFGGVERSIDFDMD